MNRLTEATNGVDLAIITCGTCRHWNKLPADPMNLGAPRQGECRERIHLTILPQQQGMAQFAGYPQLPHSFPACGQYEQTK